MAFTASDLIEVLRAGAPGLTTVVWNVRVNGDQITLLAYDDLRVGDEFLYRDRTPDRYTIYQYRVVHCSPVASRLYEVAAEEIAIPYAK